MNGKSTLHAKHRTVTTVTAPRNSTYLDASEWDKSALSLNKPTKVLILKLISYLSCHNSSTYVAKMAVTLRKAEQSCHVQTFFIFTTQYSFVRFWQGNRSHFKLKQSTTTLRWNTTSFIAPFSDWMFCFKVGTAVFCPTLLASIKGIRNMNNFKKNHIICLF